MFASRREQENAVHTRHLNAIGKPVHGSTPKTPLKQSTHYDRRERSDENIIRSGGKTGGKKKGQAFVTPIARTTRAPLTVRAANTKAFLKTPQPALRPERHPASTIKRTRRAQFKVHQAEENPNEEVEEREIEYMAPRGEPLPDLPDEDIWPHNRTYKQLEGDNFYKGWALGLFESDDDDFETKYEQALENEKRLKQVQVTTDVPPAPGDRSHGAVKPVKGYASATSSSLARSMQSRNTAPPRRKDHTRAHSAMSGSQATGRASTSSNHRPFQPTARGLQAAPYAADLEDDLQPLTPVDILELEGLSDFQLDLPDD